MNCPNCSAANPDHSRFCNNCGQQLAAAPRSAALAPSAPLTPTRPAPPVPAALAEKLLAARSARAMEGERRVVTMLFCDVKGSTAAAEQLDPEEWTDIMNGAFEQMIRPVYQFEGTVARLMGDALLAFFGAPLAHEDDPERAVRAGLAIVEAMRPYGQIVRRDWGLDFDVRVGINTGLVVVGAVGSDLRMEYTALGDAINLAARMEQTAQPGTVQIAQATYKLVSPIFECDDLGEIEVKGKEAPVRAYRVLRPRALRGRQRGLEGLESPLVGRDAELEALRTALLDIESGHGRIVSLMAEAGLGKSRLVAELRQVASSSSLHWLEGRCLSYQTSTPYAPFLDLLQSHFLLTNAPVDPAARYDYLRERIAEVAPAQADDLAPYVATLLGVPLTGLALDRVRYLEPPQLRARVDQVVGDYLEALTSQAPVVLTIDDLHWADPTSLELLQGLLPLTDRARLLILAVFRPQQQEPAWRLHETAARDFAHRYQALALKPLAAGDARQLVANLLQIEDLPARVRQLILDKAEGNPFFVEEVIRSLLDSGLVIRVDGHWRATREIEHIAVPDTLAAVIQARLDRLDETARAVIQSAAVIGRQFSRPVLTAIHPASGGLDASLTELQRRELVREKARLPEQVFIFKHALTQETAYNALLLKTRRDLHLGVAGVLERTAPDQVTDLAYHFLAARQPARALPYLLAAGERAARSYASPEAIGFYRRALEILQTEPEAAALRRAYEGLGQVQTFANQVPEALATYAEMQAAAERLGDGPMRISALNKQAYLTALRLGQFEHAGVFLEQADDQARALDDKSGLSEMGLVRCMMCTAVADFEGVIRYMDETRRLGEALGIREQIATSLTHIANSQALMLLFDRARATLTDGLRLCREIGDRQHEAEMLAMAAPLCHLAAGDLAAAVQAAEEAFTIGRAIGDPIAQAEASRLLGQCAHWQGDYEAAIAHYQRYVDTSRATGFAWSEADGLCRLGTTYLDISPSLLERVIGFHQQAGAILEQPGGTLMGASAWAEIGYCLNAAGQLDQASAYFLKGLNVPTMTINLERPRLLAGAALVNLQLGHLGEASAQAREAEAYVTAKGLAFLAPQVAFSSGRVAEAQGQPAEALAHYERAEQWALPLGFRPILWQVRAGAARALAALGHAELAGARRTAARHTVAEISALFVASDLREQFRQQASAAIDREAI